MCNKTILIMAAAINISLVALFTKLLDRLNKYAPVGYQDESGFHLGNRKN
jgi:hypothetical protein